MSQKLARETGMRPSGGTIFPAPVSWPDSIRKRGAVYYGQPGTGKSRLLENLFISDVVRQLTGTSDRGAALIDVVGDLYRNVRARLALMGEYGGPDVRRKLAQKTCLIDPTNPNWSVRWNPLELQIGDTQESLADRVVAGMTALHHGDPNVTLRNRRVAKHGILALIVSGRSLPDLPKLLNNREFRESLIASSGHPKLIDYWIDEFPKQDKEALSRVESTDNRLDIVFDPSIEELLTGPSSIDFRELIDRGAFVLVNCPAYKLGPGASYLLAGLFVLGFQQAALSRLDSSDLQRRPFSLVLDEFQKFASPTFIELAEEIRKTGLEINYATQDVRGQPKDEPIKQAIRKQVGTINCFRVSDEDARFLVRDVMSPNLDQVKDIRIRYQKVPSWFGEYTQKFEDPTFRSLDEIWEREARKISRLPDRHFWMKLRGDLRPYVVEAPMVRDIEELVDGRALAGMLSGQESAARRKTGVDKHPRLLRPNPGEKPIPDWGD